MSHTTGSGHPDHPGLNLPVNRTRPKTVPRDKLSDPSTTGSAAGRTKIEPSVTESEEPGDCFSVILSWRSIAQVEQG